MPACTGCGASYEDSYKFCPYCGHAKPEPQKINIAVDIVPKRTAYDCPLCQDANHVQKVSAIVDSGTAEGVEHSKTSGSSDYYSASSGRKIGEGQLSSTTSTNSFQQSKLAQKLALPDPPGWPPSSSWIPGCWTIGLVGGIVLFMMGALADSINAQLGVYLCSGIILIIVLVIGITFLKNKINHSDEKDKKARDDYQKKIIAYQKVKQLWKDLYYCHKHDVVFVSGKDEHAPADEAWKAYLRWSKDLVLEPEAEQKSKKSSG